MKASLAAALLLLSLAAYASDADKPAAEYHANAADLAAFQDGIAVALKAAPELFPHGIDAIDAVMYDSSDLYVWTRGEYPLTKTGTWEGYNVYKTPHGGTVTEMQMARCGGEARFAVKALMPSVRSHFLFTCSPFGAQAEIQKKRGSIYTTRESYFATVIHEYAHHYMDQELWQIPEVSALAAIVKKLKTNTSKTLVLEEAYAELCELKAARKLYPDHAARMISSYKPGWQEEHELGMGAVLELLKERGVGR